MNGAVYGICGKTNFMLAWSENKSLLEILKYEFCHNNGVEKKGMTVRSVSSKREHKQCLPPLRQGMKYLIGATREY